MISWIMADILNMANKAVFFDRDGTLNVDVHYLYRPEDFQWTPEAVEAIEYCHQQGYLVVVITNQSGVARGYYTEAEVQRLHQWMNEELARQGAKPIDAFYYCPHHPQGKVAAYAKECSCRKPQPGMLLQACQEMNIEPVQSYMVGDSPRDVEAGEKAGIKGVLYTGGSLLACVRKNID